MTSAAEADSGAGVNPGNGRTLPTLLQYADVPSTGPKLGASAPVDCHCSLVGTLEPRQSADPRQSLTTGADATLLPPRKLPTNSRYAALLAMRGRTLGSGGLYDQVRLPPGASEDEWLAVKTVEIFGELNLLTGAFRDICTQESCPKMCAGTFEYRWADGVKYPKAVRMSAPLYMETLLSWVDEQLGDEKFLPVEPGIPFVASYRKGMRTIYKRLFRIFAHLCHSHGQEMVEMECDAHVKHCFRHFIYMVKEFNLVEDSELDPLKELVTMCMASSGAAA